LRGDLAERAGGRRGRSPVGLAELDPVEQVEELGTELQVESFVDSGPLEKRKVEVIDAWTANRRVTTRCVTQRIRCGHGEAGGINQLFQSRLGGTVQLGFSSCHDIRTQAIVETTQLVLTGHYRHSQRKALLERADSVDAPP